MRITGESTISHLDYGYFNTMRLQIQFAKQNLSKIMRFLSYVLQLAVFVVFDRISHNNESPGP